MSNILRLNPQKPFEPLFKIIQTINMFIHGGWNGVGSVTLTNNGTTTTLSDNHIKPTSTIVLTPITADAQSVGAVWYDPASIPVAGGSVTLHHAAVAAADLNFRYAVFT